MAADPRLVLVVARDRRGVIGIDGGLPWRLKADLRRFRALTWGKPMIMGRKTWASIGRPLPGRASIVLTRDLSFRPRGAWAFSDFEACLAAGRAMARARGADEVAVIGGADLFKRALPMADRLYLTEVDADTPGDTVFPAFDDTAFTELRREAHPAGPEDAHDTVFRVLERSPIQA